jgi:hypothetical protein
MGPWKVPTTEEVIEFNPPWQFTHRGVSGPLAGVARGTIEPLNGGRRSRLTIALEIGARGLGKLLVPFCPPPRTEGSAETTQETEGDPRRGRRDR